MPRIAMILPLLLAACQSAPQYTWTGPGTEQQFYADRAECLAMAGPRSQVQRGPVTTGSGFGGGLAAGMAQGANVSAASRNNRQRARIFNDCMRGRSWWLTTQ